MEKKDAALVELLAALRAEGYRFIVPTPSTHHATRLRRLMRPSASLADVFGWNRRFRAAVVPPRLLTLMETAGILRPLGFGRYRSRLRVATLGEHLLLHSAFPTSAEDAVFLGPDTYRFANFLTDNAAVPAAGARVVDIGAGTGAGLIALASARPDLCPVATDINPIALRLARINLAAAGIDAAVVRGDGLAAVEGAIDVAIANPPYLGGGVGRTYRDGGDGLGAATTIAWARQAVARLAPGGRLLFYSGTAIVDGRDALYEEIVRVLETAGFDVSYRELDPDVFAGTLWRPAYRRVDRIAVVTIVATS